MSGRPSSTEEGRLSSPPGDLRPVEDVVVVGSGYGGAILACRLARAGRSVAVLERGLEWRTGEFPDRLRDAPGSVQVTTSMGRLGRRTALFDVRVERGQSVLVGCGLGGTSLINANVSLRAAPETFDDPCWPEALRGDGLRELEPYYERAEHMLGATPYPAHWPTLAKLDALADGGRALGAPIERPPINVTFQPGPNAAGVHQPSCTLCGDCCSGCNVGAKNTVVANYLPDAKAHGARIFTGTAVRRVRRAGDGWLLDVETAAGASRTRRARRTIAARTVVLAAGALGSTEILLRSAEAGLALSGRLGARFNGNGDVLGFAYGTDRDVDAVGWGRRTVGHAVGPTITGRLGVVDAGTGDPVTIEEGSIPGILVALVGPATALASLFRRELPMVERLRGAGRALRSATRRTMAYLVMSTDDGSGALRLGRRGLRVDWRDVGRQPVFAADDRALRTAAGELGGAYLAQPMWSDAGGWSLITVHPLGGCVMADDAEHGVVDDRGRVFAGARGSEVYEDLLVVDGSIIPRPLDVNPLLTISALAERAAERLVAEQARRGRR